MSGRSLTFAAVLAALFLASPTSSRAVVFETVHRFENTGYVPNGFLTQDTNGDFYGTTQYGGAATYGTVFKYSGGTVVPLANFNYIVGAEPVGRLVKAADGNFYGAASGGGAKGAGTIFQLTPAGKIKAIASFTGANGAAPTGTLLIGADGQLYGATQQGGAKGKGGIFKVSLAGVLRLLASFDPATTGGTPQGGLVKDSTGNLWGVTSEGGAHNQGTVFKLDTQNRLSVQASFETAVTGAAPSGGLTLGQDGNFYGVASQGGTTAGNKAAGGAIYKFTPGAGLSTAYVFDLDESATKGATPTGELLEVTAGHFFGKTKLGGTNLRGIIYELTVPTGGAAASVALVASFPQFSSPSGALTLGADGALWSTNEAAPGDVFRVPLPGGPYEVKATLGNVDGYNVAGGLTLGADGQLYGGAAEGGTLGNGTVFKMANDGTITHSESFGVNEARPFAQLLLASDGKLYGSTFYGNPSATLYRVDTTGAIEVLLSSGNMSSPGKLLEFNGAFYGTSEDGFNIGGGNIFKYTAANGVEVITEFDGQFPTHPSTGFVRGFDDKLLATFAGGGPLGKGAIVARDTDGTYAPVAYFNGANGATPRGPLVLGPDGSYYGLTTYGGRFNNGTVYKLTPQGQIKVLTHLNALTGAFPLGGLAFGPKGQLYGVTQQGGKGQFGTVFKVTTAGVLTVLANFDSTNGAFPQATLTAGSDGNLYGTTYSTVFRINTANHAPTTTTDSLVLPVYGARLTTNDRDVDGDALIVTSVTQPAHGTVTLNFDGTVDYVPDGTFTGTDTFTYTITDGMASAMGTANVTLPTNLLTSGAGAYVGTLKEGGVMKGYWAISVARTGVFTGVAQFPGFKQSLRGVFPASGTVTQTVTVGPNTYELTLTLNPGLNTVTGTITVASHTYDVNLVRSFPAFTAAHFTTLNGRYSLLLPPSTEALNNAGPRGFGYATVTIGATGRIAIVGKMGDGQPFSAGSALTHNDTFPMLAALAYRKPGYLLGEATFAPTADSDFAGTIAWFKPPQTVAGLYKDGFEFPGTLKGCRYAVPGAGNVVYPFALQASNATITFENASVSKTLTISNQNKVSVVMPGTEHIVMTLNATTGVFSGTFTPTGTAPVRAFSGVIYQADTANKPGQGTYVGATAADQVTLAPVP